MRSLSARTGAGARGTTGAGAAGATGTDGVATATGDVATDGEDVATTGAGELGTAAELFEADGAEDSTREVIGANFSAPTMLGDVGLVNDEVTTVTSRSSRSMEGVTTEAAGWKTSDDEPAASELLEATGSFKVVANPSHQLFGASTRRPEPLLTNCMPSKK